jgi:hypothetical protein
MANICLNSHGKLSEYFMKIRYGIILALCLFSSIAHAAITISQVQPESGGVKGGDTVIITGTDFIGVIQVSFLGIPVSNFNIDSATQITAVVPDSGGFSGSANISIEKPSGALNFPGRYTYIAPVIDAVNPVQGSVSGGTSITITGSNFTGIDDVYFNWVPATSFNIIDSNTIVAVTPDSQGTTGTVNVVIHTESDDYGQSYVFSDMFSYVALGVTDVQPMQGPASGNTAVIIAGSNFSAVTGVQFNWIPAITFNVVDDNTITALTPASSAGVVTLALDTATTTYSFPAEFTYISPPSIGAINPNTGNTYGGAAITITGNDFITGATASINGMPITALTVTATSITGTTPALPVGTYAVIVTNPDGQLGTRINSYAVGLSPAPTLTSINPSTVDTRGGLPVTITGNNFVAGTVATINGTALTNVNVGNATTITATIPALAEGLHDLVITTPDTQTITLTNAFTVTPSPEFIAGDLAPRNAPDGQLNVGDLIVMQRFISQLETPTVNEFLRANIAPLNNPDSQLNIADALILQRAISGNITLSSVIDNQAPLISIISPANNSYISANSINIMGLLDEAGSLIINDTAVTVDAFFAFSHNVNLQEGVNAITLIAADIYGNSQPQVLNINKDTQAPAAIDASKLQTIYSTNQLLVLGAAGSAEAGAIISIVINGQTSTVTANPDGSFISTVTATNGAQVQITVIDNAGNNSKSLNYTIGATLQIISPQANSTINAETVNVIGVFSAENNSGINLNSETACTYNNNFYINNVPLTAGLNTLRATYTTESGTTDSTSIDLARSGSASNKFSASINCGPAPLNITFDLDTGSNVIQQLDIDYDNDGVIDLTTTTPATAIIQNNYTAPGVYPVTAWLTTVTGVEQLSLNIVVNDEAQENDTIQAVWNGMRSALVAGNKSMAMQRLTPEAKRAYGGIFDSLMPNMAEVFEEISVAERIKISNGIASYIVLRLEDNIVKTYVINFSKGNDGVWRVDSM